MRLLPKLYVPPNFLLFCSVLLDPGEALSRCPMKKCPDCLPVEVHDAPGVGFDLGISYGTSAIKMYDGSTLDVAKVPASSEYLDLMTRLAESSTPGTEGVLLANLRRANKQQGFPATLDVGVLSKMIVELHKATQLALTSNQIDRIVITSPLLPGLTQADLKDAIEYAGLRSWLVFQAPYPRILLESKAIFAANGNGLCKTYQNLNSCKNEEHDMLWHTVLTITFTHEALYSTIDTFNAPFGFVSKYETYILDFNAGLNKLTTYPSPSDFWNHVHSQLQHFMQNSNRVITKVQLAGESVAEPKFLAILRDVLAEFAWPSAAEDTISEHLKHGYVIVGEPFEMDLDVIVDPVYAAARGAAVYARRRQEVPYNCAEGKECEVRRQGERERKSHYKSELR